MENKNIDGEKNLKEFKNGEKTINEIRKEWDLSPIPNGDKLLIPSKDNDENKNTIQMIEQMNSELSDIKKLLILIAKIQSFCNFQTGVNLQSLGSVPSSLRKELCDCKDLLGLDKIE